VEKHLFCTTIPHRNYLSRAVPAFQKSELEVIDLVSDVQDVVQYKASSEPRLNSLPQPIFHYSKVCSSPHKGFTMSRYCLSPGSMYNIATCGVAQHQNIHSPGTTELPKASFHSFQYIDMSPLAKVSLHKDIATQQGQL
jgi:hypothetical protein